MLGEGLWRPNAPAIHGSRRRTGSSEDYKLLKDAVATAVSVSEWDGPKGTYLATLGLHRAPGGFAVAQLLEGTGSVVMKDGKPAGSQASGKTVFKFASGTLAAFSGRTVNFTTKPVGLGRFELEFKD